MEPQKPSRLVSNWRSAHKWWSVRLAALSGLLATIAGYLLDPATILMAINLLYAMPPEYRWFIPPMAGFAIAAVPIFVRLWKQK